MTSQKLLNINDLKNTKWLNSKTTQKVFTALNNEGFEARAVGGAIRNSILRKPVKDIDIATTSDPETTTRLARKSGLKVIPTGLHHGTVTVISDSTPFEVTTLRQDVETDGRRATVAFTDDWQADAARRDFTMNALYADQQGKLYDPLNGYEDLIAKRVRFIGDPIARIREDYLRILRYFRFKAEYGLNKLDSASLRACVSEREGLRQLSSERIAAELKRLLVAPDAPPVIDTMFDYGLLVDLVESVILPSAMKKLTHLNKTFKVLPDAMTRLATLSLYVEEDAERLAKRLKLSNNDKKALIDILSTNPEIHKNLTELEAKKAIYSLGQQASQNKILFAWARDPAPIQDEKWKDLLALAVIWTPPTFPVKGRQLADIGIDKGPEMGKVLRCLEQKWLDSNFTLAKPQLLQIAKKISHLN